MTGRLRRLRNACHAGGRRATPAPEGQGPHGGTERSSSSLRLGERSGGSLTVAQRQAMSFYALLLLGDIKEVHSQNAAGDHLPRCVSELAEERRLLEALEGEAEVEGELANRSAALRSSLIRLRQSAATELVDPEAEAEDLERAWLAVRGCDLILGAM